MKFEKKERKEVNRIQHVVVGADAKACMTRQNHHEIINTILMLRMFFLWVVIACVALCDTIADVIRIIK